MRINWVLSEHTFLDPDIKIEELKSIGSFWGSWKTWRSCSTDNVICNDISQAHTLIQRKLNEKCNFFIPESLFLRLERPSRVSLYGGEFNFEIDSQDDIISMHLAASRSDIVLLLGFDWQPKLKRADRLEEHRAQNYRTAVKHAIRDNPETQWVLINHSETLMDELKGLDNLTIDTLPNVLSMLGS